MVTLLYRWENWNLERMRNLFKIIKLLQVPRTDSRSWNQAVFPWFKTAFYSIYVFQKELEWTLEGIWSNLPDFTEKKWSSGWEDRTKMRIQVPRIIHKIYFLEQASPKIFGMVLVYIRACEFIVSILALII